MRASAVALAAATGGRVLGDDVMVEGAGTDSRALIAGQLFVALVADRDGHAFIETAIAAGAPAYLTEGLTRPGATGILVADTAVALLALGRLAREHLSGPVVGITGSVGKTTVKELVTGVLSMTRATAASPASWNNEIGVPLTLLNAPEDTDAMVIEMGARGPGHITTLCDVARPTIGIVTRVGPAHTEFFGDEDGVAAAKAELVHALPNDGAAILNADDPRVNAMGPLTTARVVRFGFGDNADIRAETLVLDDLARPTFRLSTPEGSVPVHLSVHGAHQVSNALAAAAAGWVLEVPRDAIAEGLASVGPARWRMAVHTLAGGVRILDDTYNANPTSTDAALHALAALDGGRKIAVLGSMAELGMDSAAHHRAIVATAQDLGIECIAYASPDYGIASVTSVPALLERFGELEDGDAILVKGSRAAGLEEVVASLLEALDEPTAATRP